MLLIITSAIYCHTMEDKYYNSITSSLSVPGLFNNFALPARLLRLAREHHDFPDFNVVFGDNSGANNKSTSAYANDVIDNFYELLDKVEAALFSAHSSSKQQQGQQKQKQRKFVIEVEGLDGSGKTTLVNKLQETLLHQSNANTDNASTGSNNNNKAATPTKVIATKTPTESLHNIRPLFDKRGGILARAFYMISNYILEYEILHDDLYNATNNDKEEDVVVIIIIDRWYASTCAYTVARPPTSIANDSRFYGKLKQQQQQLISIADMPNEIFDWPKDLQLRPNLLLVLSIDQNERQKRVDYRARRVSSSSTTGVEEEGGPSRFNPWDERLARDTALGERILEALHRIRGPVETHSIDANRSIKDVLGQTLDVVKSSMERQLHQHHRGSIVKLTGS